MNDIGTYSTIILNNSKFNIYGQLRKVFTSNLLLYVSRPTLLAQRESPKSRAVSKPGSVLALTTTSTHRDTNSEVTFKTESAVLFFVKGTVSREPCVTLVSSKRFFWSIVKFYSIWPFFTQLYDWFCTFCLLLLYLCRTHSSLVLYFDKGTVSREKCSTRRVFWSFVYVTIFYLFISLWLVCNFLPLQLGRTHANVLFLHVLKKRTRASIRWLADRTVECCQKNV